MRHEDSSHGRAPARRAAAATVLVALAVAAYVAWPAPDAHGNAPAAPSGERSFSLFESDQVRPLALSPDGRRLFAVNTPDNRLEVFRVKPSGDLSHQHSIPVGLEPVAVAARSRNEVWVVNHLSDSVSVVRIDDGGAQVVRTLLVGDEPRDIVFAGPGNGRAFITAAHRGQNAPFDPELTTPGIGRADVWVFDAANLGPTAGGSPLAIIRLFTDKPRALAASADGSRVYAAGYMTGNRTSLAVTTQTGPIPPPLVNREGQPPPPEPLIVQWNGRNWVDEVGLPHDQGVRLSLPDLDVFAIDAGASPPRLLPGPAGAFPGVGTTLFNMAVNPLSGRVYVSNLEANNLQRFEGPGELAGSSMRGHIAESRITVIDPVLGVVAPRHLNKHIDYDACCAPLPNEESAKSLAFPLSMAVTADGGTLYVAALGSSEVGVFDAAEIEADTFVPSAASHIRVSGGGPTGLALDEQQGRLYVLTRFDNAIAVVDTVARREVAKVRLFNPEPESIVRGRPFLYDARLSSAHGDSSCASCHLFGDFDALAWDLGNPDGIVLDDPNPFTNETLRPRTFHPMKGPMTTQSLRGMANHGPMHWRGDRTGAYIEPSVQPDGGAFNEFEAFMAFRPAFAGLLGRSEPISEADMAAFTAFALQIMYPPNPIRSLDNSLNPQQQAGKDAFSRFVSFAGKKCIECHVIDPQANAGLTPFPGFFGSDGLMAETGSPQHTKNAHLRNVYQKVGMFGMPPFPVFPGPIEDNMPTGDQVRGFGFTHSGEVDTLFRFNRAIDFSAIPLVNPDGIPAGAAGDGFRRDMEAFMLAFDSNHAPIVGQQITLTGSNGAVSGPRIDLFERRAEAGECELIVKGLGRGWLYAGGGRFLTDSAVAAAVADADLRALAAAGPLTFTCAPVGEGVRRGLDRDADGWRDGDERAAGTDPADPNSHP